MRLLITLLVLAFAQLFFNMAHASPHAPISANHHKVDSSAASSDERRKRRPVKAAATRKVKESLSKKTRQPVKTTRVSAAQKLKLKKKTAAEPVKAHQVVKSKISAKKLAKNEGKKRYGHQRGEHKKRTEEENVADAPLKLSKAHRARYQKARETAMNKLMGQLGKPYQWGGPRQKPVSTAVDWCGMRTKIWSNLRSPARRMKCITCGMPPR